MAVSAVLPRLIEESYFLVSRPIDAPFGRVDGGGNIFDIRNTDRSVYIRSASGRRHAEVRRCVSTDLSFQPYVP